MAEISKEDFAAQALDKAFDMNQMRELMHHPFPASTKQAAGLVGGIPTDVMCVSFSDKILITITQKGRLAQWVCDLVSTAISICIVFSFESISNCR